MSVGGRCTRGYDNFLPRWVKRRQTSMSYDSDPKEKRNGWLDRKRHQLPPNNETNSLLLEKHSLWRLRKVIAMVTVCGDFRLFEECERHSCQDYNYVIALQSGEKTAIKRVVSMSLQRFVPLSCNIVDEIKCTHIALRLENSNSNDDQHLDIEKWFISFYTENHNPLKPGQCFECNVEILGESFKKEIVDDIEDITAYPFAL